MKSALKSYGPLPADRAAGFEDYLQQVIGPDDYTRRGAGSDVYFDVSILPSPMTDLELQNIITGINHPKDADVIGAERGPQYRESRINVFDSSRGADPWSAASGRRRAGRTPFDESFTWNVF